MNTPPRSEAIAEIQSFGEKKRLRFVVLQSECFDLWRKRSGYTYGENYFMFSFFINIEYLIIEKTMFLDYYLELARFVPNLKLLNKTGTTKKLGLLTVKSDER